MSFLDGVRHQLRVWARGDAYEREMAEEARFHMSLEAAQRPEADRAGAADAARRRYGNETLVYEERRREARLDLLDGVRLDGRHLLRSIRRAPGFAVVAVLTLGFGIGITTTFASLADHILVRGLPFAESSRLMMMLERDEHGAFRTPSAPTANDWAQDPGVARALEGVTYVRGDGLRMGSGDDMEFVGTAFVAPEFFPLVRVTPTLGRLLNAEDHRMAAPVALMSHRLWKRRFGGDPTIVGRRVFVDSMHITIVGVLPVGAVYPGFADLWTPISRYSKKGILQQRGFHADSRTIGRLRENIDSGQAAALMRTVGARLAALYPVEQKGWMPTMIPMQREVVGDIGPMLWLFASAGAAILLLACANVANLLLARVASRSRELAVRNALGASRARILRQLLTESIIIALIGGTLGVALTAIGLKTTVLFFGDRLPRVDELVVDYRVLLIAAAATLATAIACGLWPSLRSSTQSGLESLRLGGVTTARAQGRVRRGLVTVQFALALVLLVGAGLLVQSFKRVADVDVGFDPDGLLTARIGPASGTPSADEALALYRRLMEATRSVPGVHESAFVSFPPYGSAMFTTLSIEGRSTLDSSNQVFYRTVSDSFFRTMRMSLAAGRWFDESDMRAPAGKFVINETMARQYWPGRSAIGQRITVRRASQARADFGQPLPGEVIGVIANVHQGRLDQAPDAEVYVPFTLETWPWGFLVMRARDGERSIPALTRAIASVDPRLVRPRDRGAGVVSAVERSIADSLRPRKLSMSLISAFAACALLLAAIAMYGIVAYGVAQRTREIGVRKALGATDRDIMRLLFRESTWVVLAGIVVGSTAAVASARLIRGLLFQTDVTDPLAFGATIVVLAAAAGLATYVPARRAIRLDPSLAMRVE